MFVVLSSPFQVGSLLGFFLSLDSLCRRDDAVGF